MNPEILNGVFAIGGTIAGGIIGFYSSLHANKRLLRVEAASNLRKGLIPIIMKINTSGFASEMELRNAVVARFENHAIDIETFRFYVSQKNLEAYDQAYQEYHSMVSNRPINFGSKLSPDKFYANKVKAILKFAQPH